MRTLKHLAIFAVVVLVAVFLAAPSAMAKKQLAEDELELITALTLNNVVGENQVASGVNIGAAITGTSNAQSISITQSWGAIKDLGSVSTKADGGAGCTTLTEKCLNTKGGNGSTKIALLSALADDIVMTDGPQSSIFVNQIPQFDLALASGVQQNLAALVVNNVVGINQVASGVNIQSGNLSFLPALGVNSSAGTTSGSQSIAIDQWRGVVKARPGFSVP